MKYTVNLVIGDWSQLGHGILENISIKTNATPNGIRTAFITGSSMIGFNLTEDVGSGPSVNGCILYDNQYWALCKAGIPVADILEDSELLDEHAVKPRSGSKPRYRLSLGDFKKLWLHISKLGCPALEWEESPEMATINIGGYALFEQ